MGELLSGIFDGMTPVAEAPQSNFSQSPEASRVNPTAYEPARPVPVTGTAAAAAGVPAVADGVAAQTEVSSSFALASSSTGSLADTVIRVLNSVGLDAGKYERRLEEARSALLVSIGVGGTEPLDGYAPGV